MRFFIFDAKTKVRTSDYFNTRKIAENEIKNPMQQCIGFTNKGSFDLQIFPLGVYLDLDTKEKFESSRGKAYDKPVAVFVADKALSLGLPTVVLNSPYNCLNEAKAQLLKNFNITFNKSEKCFNKSVSVFVPKMTKEVALDLLSNVNCYIVACNIPKYSDYVVDSTKKSLCAEVNMLIDKHVFVLDGNTKIYRYRNEFYTNTAKKLRGL